MVKPIVCRPCLLLSWRLRIKLAVFLGLYGKSVFEGLAVWQVRVFGMLLFRHFRFYEEKFFLRGDGVSEWLRHFLVWLLRVDWCYFRSDCWSRGRDTGSLHIGYPGLTQKFFINISIFLDML